MSTLTGAVFLDKDGTLLVDQPHNVEPERMRLAPGAAEGLKCLGKLGVPLVVVSNQPGVALGMFEARALAAVEAKLHQLFDRNGAQLSGFYFCPHAPEAGSAEPSFACSCRKPRPGLLYQAAADLQIDLWKSWMIGDILDDVEAGSRVGCRTILIDCGNETQWKMTERTRWLRTADFTVDDLEAAAGIVAAQGVRPAVHPERNPDYRP